ncbi:putative Far upstream element-binding protein 2 [Glarea lozoyensis 74030]|uniref:Putative Far upstream element-binding protein 2 n=1 Tax=Glarea lozoyensis (strain ATCC 74030 / MF5533) TaxID=1104152 RepID=H0ET16_GLAL7|nr:putative Far upstream element-binding protein 2 [Glarea lozoyensis 74030]
MTRNFYAPRTEAKQYTPVPQPQQPPYHQPPQQNPYAGGGGYTLPQPTNSGSVDLSGIKPTSVGSVSIADAIAKAKAIAAERGVQPERNAPYGGPDPRRPGGGPYRMSRSRSRSPPARRDQFRENANPYRDERRGDRAPPSRDYRERSFSPGARGRNPSAAFQPPAGGNYARERSPPRGDDMVESLQIESNLVGLIIGRQGENLRRVESETGCRVQFITGHDEQGPFRQCKITGPRARRADAKAEINRIIDDSGMAGNPSNVGGARIGGDRNSREPPSANRSSHQPALRDGEDSMQIMVPDRTVGLIIGRGGETIRDLQERSGCHVNIVGEQKSVNGLRPVNLIGSREAAAHAKDLIMEIVESDSKTGAAKEAAPGRRDPPRDQNQAGYAGGGGGGADKINDKVYVPSEAVGMIIGKRGETIKEMQNTTGCKINVTPSSGSSETQREIGLVGSREAIAAARRAIEDKVDAVYSQSQGQAQVQAQGSAPPAGGEDPYAACT